MIAAFASIIAPNIKIDSTNKEITFFDKTSSYTIKDKDFDYGDEEGRVTIKDNVVTISSKDSDVLSVKLSDNSITEIEKFIENDVPKHSAGSSIRLDDDRSPLGCLCSCSWAWRKCL